MLYIIILKGAREARCPARARARGVSARSLARSPWRHHARPCAGLREANQMSTRTVGHYLLGRTLGEGTFAKVKLAKDTETQTLYAMKIFSRADMSAELQRKVKEEIAIMKHVKHPNVVNLHEVLASKTHVYIVLELVTGGELFDRIVTSGAWHGVEPGSCDSSPPPRRQDGGEARTHLLPPAH